MAAKTSLSGFPEWLPAERIVEQRVLDILRRTFELHGFAPLETRSVEPVRELERKGETSKEIYLLSRLQDRGGHDAKADKSIGLHFDLTVPFARYIGENAGSLHFPFRRYQIQKVWRGERPQEGRFREFYQADIDVVGAGELAFHHEVEVPLVMAQALAALPIPPVQMHVNNRKIVQGMCEALGIEQVDDALRSIDKLDKIGQSGVLEEMTQHGIDSAQGERLLQLAQIHGGLEVLEQVRALGLSHPLLDEGLEELEALLQAAEKHAPGVVIADLKITRGLDYYTGSVYETFLRGHEDLGSICSGGRYDSLVTVGKRTYPGVGMSIGVSRLISRILGADMARASREVPSCVLVAVTNESERDDANEVAYALRERGIPTEVSPSSSKFGKQIRYADRRGIPYVWFTDEQGGHSVKDIRSGEQVDANPQTWQPPQADRWPSWEL
ncbi:histidine--tRNA ligase [Gleimia hominis]|uniref:Histidine--tRNA ligase n=1 Tax=Gleimia hominis TaxID=595468 RepID=A0ABU3ICN3_9ACTO|nr:histidine--tRNA ligase [Gleimia hominis]MDT3767691.1 histidine--tRNA ligase [Gleimia hominis]